jgi:TctA family transporter
LIGLFAVTTTSDTITCVLLAIPGSAGSVATIVDGHPMARRGEAARALSAAFIASCFGGIFGAVILALSIPIIGPLVKQFASPELLMLTMLGIAAVSLLTGRQPLKGLMAAGIGLMLSSVGPAPMSPWFRFSFGIPYLYEGVPLVLLALGVFGLPEIIDLIARGLPISGDFGIGKGVLQGVKDTIRNKWLILRCSILGCYIGFVPGMGGSVANWIGYGHAVQSAKGEGTFGKGDVRGVIGPESANNAARGGELIPTLLFGVPGCSSMALFLLALIWFGKSPGPDMLTKDLDLVFQIVWTLVLGNIIGALICTFLAKYLARVATVKISILAPFVFIILVMGAFQATQDWGDLLALLLLGLLGWTMKQAGFARPPLIVGFVLGTLAERYLGLSLTLYGMTWIWHPMVIGIGIIIFLTIYYGIKFQRKQTQKELERQAMQEKALPGNG